MGLKKSDLTKEQRLDQYDTISLNYWEMWYKFKDMDGKADFYQIKEVMNKLGALKKERNSVAGHDAKGNIIGKNNLSLHEMKDIDDKIKLTLRD
jgi:hypothetical protein